MLNQNDARKIAKKLIAEIKPGRRHDLVTVQYEQVTIAQFGISRSSKEKPHNYIPRQLYITGPECRDLLNCPMTRKQYFVILENKNLLPPSK